jgi:hypothetical protein
MQATQALCSAICVPYLLTLPIKQDRLQKIQNVFLPHLFYKGVDMKRIYFLACITVISTSTFCDQQTPANHTSETEQYVTVGDAHCADNDAQETTDKHINDIASLILNIMQHPTDIKLVIHNVSHIMSDLLHMALHIFDSRETETTKNALLLKKYCEHMDAQTQQRIIDAVEKMVAEYKFTAQNNADVPYKATAKDKEETEIVLGHFAHIVGSVFNILREPDDKPTIVNNIVNIIANTAQIALLGRKSGKLSSHADIEQYVAQTSDETKIAIGTMIIQAVG